MKNLLYIFLVTSLLAGCKKEDPMPTTKTYTGKLVADCNMVPMANSPIKVFIREPQSFGSNTIINDFTTDANGDFDFTVNLDNGKYVNEVRLGGTSITPDGPNENNMGTIIASPTANFVIKLKVNNPYGVGDTLFIKDFSTMTNVKIAAPFSDYVFNTTYNYSSIQNRTLTNKNSVEISTGVIIYNGKLYSNSYNQLILDKFDKIIPACTGMVDTVLIEIN
jgi:hypothetical protein